MAYAGAEAGFKCCAVACNRLVAILVFSAEEGILNACGEQRGARALAAAAGRDRVKARRISWIVIFGVELQREQSTN